MHLKRIILEGFKTFAHRTEVPLQAVRTVIVGPNGSGKSNVLDAIRWVLGSQSPKALRASSMQDVIFSGTEHRPPAPYAEVTLVFDNADGYFPVAAPELTITRRLTRDGVSTYRINGEECRLKDIHRLFVDTGLGKNGYGIVSQGRVAEVLDADPDQLRALFEGVAGISGLREQKEAVLRSLEGLAGDLSRLETVMQELERSLKPLERQAAQAERYLQLRRELDVLEVGYLCQQESVLAERERALREQVAGLSSEIQALAAQESALTLRIAGERQVEQQLSERIAEMRREQQRLLAERAETGSRLEVLAERRRMLGARRAELGERIQEVAAAVEQALQRHSALVEAIARCETEDRAQAAEAERLEGEVRRLADQEAVLQAEAARLQEQVYQVLSDHSAVTSRLARVERDLEAWQRESAAFAAERAALERRRAELCAARDQAQAEHGRLKAHLEALLTEQESLLRAREAAARAHAVSRQRAYALRAELARREAELSAFREMEERSDGYPRAVKAALTHARASGMDGVLGTVADLVQPKAGFAVAIEQALGAASQNIVCRDDREAAALIRYLQETRQGRATFLPLGSLRPRVLLPEEWQGAGAALTPAVEAVVYPPEIAPAVALLLGRTLIARTLEEARRAARALEYRVRIVTLDGSVIAPGGAMTGGFTGARGAQLLVRREEIRRLERERERLQGALAEADAEAARSEAALQEAEQTLAATAQEIEAARADLAHAEADLARAEAQLESLDARSAELAARLDEAAEAALCTERESLRAQQAELEARAQRERERLAGLRSQIETVQSALRAAEAARSRVLERQEAVRAELVRLRAALAEATGGEPERLEALRAEARQVDAELTAAAGEQEALSQRLAALQAEIDRTAASLGSLEAEHRALRERIARAEEERDGVLSRLRAAESALKERQVEQAEVAHQLEDARRRLREIAEESGAVRVPADLDLTDAPERIRRLQSEIRRLGHVNLVAREEYARIRERYDAYAREHADLTGSRSEILAALEALDAQMAEALALAHQRVNAEFAAVFTALFGGGHAAVEVQNPERILESGFAIRARPPGKRMQPLSLLSGGERSLAALALIFAILRYKPSPIVILDEVDAALDEMNVELLAEYLAAFRETQFIIVTHRRPLMRIAQAIYGASMEEKGITKLVSTRLDQLDRAGSGGAAS